MAFLHGTSYLILGLTAFCIYHAYKNGSEQRWFWIIIIFPILGSLFYLYTHFYSKENVQTIADGVASTVNKNHNIKKLEKQLEFSPSIINKSNLADEYVKLERYEDAEKLYLSCLEGFNKNDISLNQKLMACYSLNHKLEKAIEIGKSIEGHRDFKKSEFRISYAKALAEFGELKLAEEHFKEMNSNYSNYPHRIAYVQFLQHQSRHDEASALILKMENEWQNMNRAERKSIPGLKSQLTTLKNI